MNTVLPSSHALKRVWLLLFAQFPLSRLGDFKGTNLLADIGNGTLNILYINNKKAVESRCWTEKFGVNQCMRAAKNAVMDSFGVKIEAETKFTAELDSTLEKYNALEQDAANVDVDELTDSRMELRSDKEQSTVTQLQKVYGDKYDYDMMRQSKLEVKKMLGEDTRKHSIKQALQRKEPEVQMPTPKKKKQKDYER